jgi:DUF1680 family protein
VYAQKSDSLYINLFINSSADLVINKKKVELIQNNHYPWDGNLIFRVIPASTDRFTMLLRIPGWAQNEAIPSSLYSFQHHSDAKPIIRVNGKEIDYSQENGYALISRTWNKNDEVELVLPMEIRKVAANQKLKDDIGKTAIQRGPLMYCAEWVDNRGKTSNIILPDQTRFTPQFQPDLLNGVMVLKAEVPAVVINDPLHISTTMQPFTAIPYYSWANRGKGEMQLWFPREVKEIELISN